MKDDRRHRRVRSTLGKRLLALGHGGKRDGLVGLGGGRSARVLHREKPLGTARYSSAGQRQRGGHQPGQARCASTQGARP